MKNTNKKFKSMTMSMAVLMLAFCIIGGTVAYLTSVTPTIENTFTFGAVKITLEETTGDEYKLTPNATLDKDPTITVKANSEACWVFVKIEKSDNLDDYIEYTVESVWTALDGVDGVYYLEATASATDTAISVLTGDKVTVTNFTEKPATNPTLSFTGYACQKDGVATAAEAWNIVKDLTA